MSTSFKFKFTMGDADDLWIGPYPLRFRQGDLLRYLGLPVKVGEWIIGTVTEAHISEDEDDVIICTAELKDYRVVTKG